jgi:EmrB/QacA subfamily drug resistance transporter
LATTITAASLPMFMAALDNLVLTFALPVIREELGAMLTGLQWFMNAYTIAFAALMMPMAALGDRIGRRTVFLAGIAIFTLASAGAALSTTPTVLIAARTFQGIGGAAIVPLSLTLLSVASPPGRRAMSLGIWGGVNGLGIAVGPVIGGAVVSGLDWSAIFWLNVPIGIVALVLGRATLPESLGARARFDGLGIALAALFLLPATWALVESPQRGWSDPRIVGAFCLALLALGAFLHWERSSASAFLPLRLFRDRTFNLANLATFLFAASVFGAIFLLSQFLQVSMGYSALEAGLRAMPWTLAPMVVAPLAGLIIGRVGLRTVLITGTALQAAGLGWLAALMSADVDYAGTVVPMGIAGVGMGLTFSPLSTAALHDRPEEEQGVASGANSTIRQLGMVMGIAACTAIFTASGDYLPGRPFADGLRPALVTCAVTLVMGTACVASLPRRSRRVGGPTSRCS